MERATKKETVKKEAGKRGVKAESTGIDEEKLAGIIKKEDDIKVSAPVIKKEIDPVIKVITTETSVTEKEILLKNTGGSFHMGRRRIIKPGEKFKAKWSDIPMGFRDTIYPLEDVPIKAEAPLLSGKKSEFELIPKGETEEDGFDVINKETGKKINGKPLPKATADKLIEDLSK
jgi:hypothetical protein